MKCYKCGAEIRWSEFHEAAYAFLWDGIYAAYYSAIFEIQRLIWLARKTTERKEDFGDAQKEVLRLLLDVKNLAERALAKFEAEKAEVAEERR
jgi:hypothetical protein